MKSRHFLCTSLALWGAGLFTPLVAQITVASAPVGVVSAPLPSEESGLTFPLIARDLLLGTATGNTGGVVSFAASHGAIGEVLTASGRYYLEVLSGPLEGERFGVDTAATIAAGAPSVTLSFGAGTHSTLASLTADALVGARCALRPHTTLASLKAMFTPALHGNNTATKADGVLVYEADGFAFYYLRGDGVTWRKLGGSTADQRHLVIPPDVSVVVELQSGAKTWLHTGGVRTNAFRKNLSAGWQSFATGFPIDLSPLAAGAFVDASVPASEQWTGSDDIGKADQFQVSFAASAQHALYYLRGDGTTWRSIMGGGNVTTSPILGVTTSMLLRRTNPDSGYVIVPPYDSTP